jgi:PKHD-type hydroxylase
MVHSTEPVQLAVELPKITAPDAPGGGFPLRQDRVCDWSWTDGVFTVDELDAIVTIGERVHMDRAFTGAGRNTSTKMRDSFVSWLFPNEVTSWIFERMANVVNRMNDEFFGFDLQCMEQGFQFTRYQAPGEHYDWHVDRGGGHGIRKLSITVQLSDPDAYEGGDLELWFGGDQDEALKAERGRGVVTVFPSWVMHRVTPVTAGARHSLVCWVSGPSFK